MSLFTGQSSLTVSDAKQKFPKRTSRDATFLLASAPPEHHFASKFPKSFHMHNRIAITWIFLLSLGVIWGASFLGVSFALHGFGPVTVAAIRVSIAAIILTIVGRVVGHPLPAAGTPKGRKIWMFAFGMAIFSNALPFSLLSWSQLHVSSGYAGITMAVVPLLVLPMSHFLVPAERLTSLKVFGFLIGFAGVVVLIGPAQILQAGGGNIENVARIAAILASACYATGSIITRLSPSAPLLTFSAAALILASAILIPLALLIDGVPAMPTIDALMGVLYLAVFPTALATILLVFIATTAGPPFLSLVNYQVPVWAVIFGMVFLGESLPTQFLAALGLILAGLAISQARVLRGLLRATAP